MIYKSKVKHNHRLNGWTDNQIVAFNRATKGALRGKLITAASVHPRVRNTLESRRVIFVLNDKVQLTELGLAVAKSCGWIKSHES
jgi:hypothetical protein